MVLLADLLFVAAVGTAIVVANRGWKRDIGRKKTYRSPEEQIQAEFPRWRREEVRRLLEFATTYTPPQQRDEVMFRMLHEARGSLGRLRKQAVSELAVLPDGTRPPPKHR